MGLNDKLQILGVSLGSSRRDYRCEIDVLGRKVSLTRIGVNGDVAQAKRIIAENDGKVSAIGLGGTDLYIYAGKRRYVFRESKRIAECAKVTPVVDGSGLKNSLERLIVKQLLQTREISGREKVLMVCGVDRFGMAEELNSAGCSLTFGDLMFGLGVPLTIRKLGTLRKVAQFLAPIVTQLPISWLYPTGKQQEIMKPRFATVFEEAEIIAGDWHFIRRNMPEDLHGKTILTNTITAEDVAELRGRNLWRLVTTTPYIGQRAFGTNVMEAMLVAMGGDYEELLRQLDVKPNIIDLQK